MFGNAWHNFAGFMVTSLILMLGYPAYLNLLGETNFGIFMLVIAFPSLVSMFGFGIFSSVTYFVSKTCNEKTNGNESAYIALAMAFYTLLGACLSTLIFFGASQISERLFDDIDVIVTTTQCLKFMGPAIPFILIVSVMIAAWKGRNDFKTATRLVIGQQLCMMLLPLLCCYFIGYQAVSDIFIYYLLAQIALFVATAKHFVVAFGLKDIIKSIDYRTSKVLFFRMITFGTPTALAGSITMLITQLPRILIAMWFGPAEVGIFALAFGVASKLQTASNSLSEVLFPHIAASKRTKNFSTAAVRVFFATGLLTMILALPLLIFSDFFLTLWVGEKMAIKTELTLKLLVIAYAISSVASTNHHFLNGIGKPIKNFQIAAAQLTVFLITVILLRETDLNGPIIFAYAFITSHLVVLALSIHYSFLFHRILSNKSH